MFRAIRLSSLLLTVLANVGKRPLVCRLNILTSKYILKIFSLDSHLALDKLFQLQLFSRVSRKKNPRDYFLLYRSFKRLPRYKSRVATLSDLPAVYLVNYSALIAIPPAIITPSISVDNICSAPISQLVFLLYMTSLLMRILLSSQMSLEEILKAMWDLLSIRPLTIFKCSMRHLLHRFFWRRSWPSCMPSAFLQHSIPMSIIFTDSCNVAEVISSLNFGHSDNCFIYSIKQKLNEIKEADLSNVIVWILAHYRIFSETRRQTCSPKGPLWLIN